MRVYTIPCPFLFHEIYMRKWETRILLAIQTSSWSCTHQQLLVQLLYTGFNSRCPTFISVCNQPVTKVNSAFHPSGVSENEYQLRLGRQRQVWFIPLADERGCAGKTVRSLENACHTWAPYRCVHDEALYKSTFTLPYLTWQSSSVQFVVVEIHPTTHSVIHDWFKSNVMFSVWSRVISSFAQDRGA